MITQEKATRRDRHGVDDFELMISNLLRYGVLTSVFVVLVGMALSFVHHPAYLASPEALPELTVPTRVAHDLNEVVAGLLALRGQAVVTLGLLLLLAVPVARVGLSCVLFARMRDGRFVIITSIVFTLLVVSFVIGAGE